MALSDALAADQCEMKSSMARFGMARSIAGRQDTRQARLAELSKAASWVAANYGAIVGVSPVRRSVFGGDTGDLPIMKRSEMTPIWSGRGAALFGLLAAG